MEPLDFSQEFVSQLASERTPALTLLMQGCSLLAELEGYMLVIVLLFVLYDKRLAIQSAVLVIVTMTLNHLLKIVIRNPRPFVEEDTYIQNWAIATQNVTDLVAEYSTPSGTAMAAAAFYILLLLKIRNTAFSVLCVVVILLNGISRPYLGVHYAEDIAIGWLLGIVIGIAGARYADQLTNWWSAHQKGWHATVGFTFGLCVWGVTLYVSDRVLEEQPLAFISYLGFLLGILITYPMEIGITDYRPNAFSISKGIGRVVVMGSVLVGAMVLLDFLFGIFANEQSLTGHALRYLRYALVAAAGVIVSPLLFRRMRIV